MKKSNSHDVLFSLFLLPVFLLCSMFIILIGSRIYENIRANNDISFYSNTAVSYITNKVRQTDRADSVEVREIDRCSVLVLPSSTSGLRCEAWTYTLNGVLKGLYAKKDSGLTVEDGLDVMECISLGFTLQEATSQLTIHLKTEPSDIMARLLLRNEPRGGVES